VTFLRFLALVALALWIGGLAALGGVAAPAIFDVLEARQAIEGRELAGVVFGEIFSRFQHASWVLGGLLIVSLGARAALGPRPRQWGLRMWTVTAMVAASVGSALFIAPRIDAIRTSVSGPVAALSETDPRRVDFGRWHGISTGLMFATLVAGAWLLRAEMKDGH